MDKQQLVIVNLYDRQPITEDTRYMLGNDDVAGQTVILLDAVTPDDLLANDPAVAYGTLRVITDRGVEIVSTVGLGVLIVPAE